MKNFIKRYPEFCHHNGGVLSNDSFVKLFNHIVEWLPEEAPWPTMSDIYPLIQWAQNQGMGSIVPATMYTYVSTIIKTYEWLQSPVDEKPRPQDGSRGRGIRFFQQLKVFRLEDAVEKEVPASENIQEYVELFSKIEKQLEEGVRLQQYNTALEADIAGLRSEISEKDDRIQELDDELGTERKARSNAEDSLHDLKEEMENLSGEQTEWQAREAVITGERNEAQHELAKAQTTINGLQQEKQQLQTKLAEKPDVTEEEAAKLLNSKILANPVLARAASYVA